MANRLIIETPTLTQRPGGLFSVANVIPLGDKHGAFGGISVLPDPACDNGTSAWASDCLTMFDVAVTIHLDATPANSKTTAEITNGIPGPYSARAKVGTAAWSAVSTTNFDGTTAYTFTFAESALADGDDVGVEITDPLGVVHTATGVAATGDVVATFAAVNKNQYGVGDPINGSPVVVYAAVQCGPFDHDSYAARSTRTLELGQQRAIEKYLWTSIFPNGATTIGTTAVTPAVALGEMEDELAEHYDGLGIIHMAPSTATELFADDLLVNEGTRVVTNLGTLVAVGAGYTSQTGPFDKSDAAAGDHWMYATGAILLYQGALIQFEANALTTNEFSSITERNYIPIVECGTFAVLVS